MVSWLKQQNGNKTILSSCFPHVLGELQGFILVTCTLKMDVNWPDIWWFFDDAWSLCPNQTISTYPRLAISLKCFREHVEEPLYFIGKTWETPPTPWVSVPRSRPSAARASRPPRCWAQELWSDWDMAMCGRRWRRFCRRSRWRWSVTWNFFQSLAKIRLRLGSWAKNHETSRDIWVGTLTYSLVGWFLDSVTFKCIDVSTWLWFSRFLGWDEHRSMVHPFPGEPVSFRGLFKKPNLRKRVLHCKITYMFLLGAPCP